MGETQSASTPGELTDQDREQIRLLSIFHYVVAAMELLFCSFPLIHVAIGIGIVSGRFPVGDAEREKMPELFGWAFIALPGLMVLLGWASAIAIAIAGRKLARMEQRTYCLVVACLACMFMPVGTVLGALTIIVLMRPAVVAAFQRSA
jgi:hypothetical protein